MEEEKVTMRKGRPKKRVKRSEGGAGTATAGTVVLG